MRTIPLLLFLTLLLWADPHHAGQSVAATASVVRCEYETLSWGHSDGISKSYCGRQIARVMGWQGASWLDRPERIREERTDQLITLLDLKPGMVVADIGAGTGSLSVQMLDRVRPDGQVWAVDVQPEMVAKLQALAKRTAGSGFRVVQSSTVSPNLPLGIFDMAVMVDAYHEFEFPREMLQSLKSAMKPGGLIVFVEYRANDPSVPIRALHTMSLGQIRKEAEHVGLVFERVLTGLPWQNVVVFKVAPPR
jgi:ubiquinone/menaquinone biosynthesis C-methylase UbiE